MSTRRTNPPSPFCQYKSNRVSFQVSSKRPTFSFSSCCAIFSFFRSNNSASRARISRIVFSKSARFAFKRSTNACRFSSLLIATRILLALLVVVSSTGDWHSLNQRLGNNDRVCLLWACAIASEVHDGSFGEAQSRYLQRCRRETREIDFAGGASGCVGNTFSTIMRTLRKQMQS